MRTRPFAGGLKEWKTQTSVGLSAPISHYQGETAAPSSS